MYSDVSTKFNVKCTQKLYTYSVDTKIHLIDNVLDIFNSFKYAVEQPFIKYTDDIPSTIKKNVLSLIQSF